MPVRAGLEQLLARLGTHPVLVDVGSSGTAPRIWQPIAPHSIYVGFDPDQRDLTETAAGAFHKSVIVNKAITHHVDADKVRFFFTKQPHCSSTLQPDHKSLSDFLFADRFAVEREGTVPAGTINTILDSLGLHRIDWLKIDTQGTDLRIWRSLNQKLREGLLALDIEPGLVDAYKGEDLFVDAHRELTGNGFWLSNLNVRGAVRIRRESLEEAGQKERSLTVNFLEIAAKKSPAWCEARYLRNISSMTESNASKCDWALLWLIAMLDGQAGFALDVARDSEKRFGKDDVSEFMKDQSIAGLRRWSAPTLIAWARSFAPAPLKKWIKSIMGR
jgi:hypothetical protein